MIIDDPSLTNRDELCRQGKLQCPRCTKTMQMYYRPQCFHCKQPEGKEVRVVEIIPALYYIENQGNPDFKRHFWKVLMKLEFSNDTYIRIDKGIAETEDEDELLDTFKEYYPDYEDILWFISW